jgi:hypothetical protein
MSDCRLILNNLNDYVSLKGPLVTGSDVVDISEAQMIAGVKGWQIVINTVNPAQQNPRLHVTVSLYLDIDGQMDNNATVGLQLGADTVYKLDYVDGQWKMSKEQSRRQNIFSTVLTQATYRITNIGYAIDIPYSEVPKNAPNYWKVSVSEQDANRFTLDYAPGSGMACAPSLTPKNSWIELATHAKYLWDTGLGDQVVVGAVVIAALVVIFFKWKKTGKKKP